MHNNNKKAQTMLDLFNITGTLCILRLAKEDEYCSLNMREELAGS